MFTKTWMFWHFSSVFILNAYLGFAFRYTSINPKTRLFLFFMDSFNNEDEAVSLRSRGGVFLTSQ